jgi:hypothetical protein
MEDDQTGSLWSQISGECIRGELSGKKLNLYPAQFSTFGVWRSDDRIRFLVKPESGPNKSVYKDYYEDRGRMGIFGTIYNDSLLDGKDIVYGVRASDYQMAIPKSLFADQAAYLASLDTLQLIVVVSTGGGIAAYNLPPAIDDWKLKFENGRIDVLMSSSDTVVFSFEEGIQVAGKPLANYPVVTAFWFAWKAFFPAGSILEP